MTTFFFFKMHVPAAILNDDDDDDATRSGHDTTKFCAQMRRKHQIPLARDLSLNWSTRLSYLSTRRRMIQEIIAGLESESLLIPPQT